MWPWIVWSWWVWPFVVAPMIALWMAAIWFAFPTVRLIRESELGQPEHRDPRR
jgi:hypothetical protein